MTKKQRFNWLFIIVTITAITLSFMPIHSQAALDTSPQANLERAWELVQKSGSYHFSSRVVQTTHPAPSIANAGRSSRVESVYLDGNTDLPTETILMRMWQGDGNIDGSSDAFEIRVNGEQTFGRISSGDWQQMDSFTGGFAPGNDFSTFLAAARNVKTLESSTPNIEKLGFDISGPVLAEMIRDQLEEYLQREGELPTGIRLSTPEQYRDAIGTGEVWIDGDGLPLRLSIDMQYPQQANGERVEAQISTDFADFNREATAKLETPADQIQASVSQVADKLQKPETLISVSFVGLMMLAFTNRHSKKVYTAIVAVVIFSMVVTPLLESAQVYAYAQKQAAAEAENQEELEQQQAAQDAEAEIYGSDWDPHQNPAEVSEEQIQEAPIEVISLFPGSDLDINEQYFQALAASSGSSSSTDTDGDGLVDDDDPCPDNADCDGDGLSDLHEQRLGTDPESMDTDGDLITDEVEVAGFWYHNEWWYSNPLVPDTNNDTLLDGLECPEQARPDENSLSPHDKACLDTDGDGEPDIFDRDNDGDSVPDPVDLSPFSYEDNNGEPFSIDNPMLLQVDSLQPGQPAFVDFQLRPENTDHLWYALNVLDWPSGDEGGQIQRKSGNDSTFADLATGDQPASETASNGDMRLIPMLEIEMTGDTIPLALTNPLTDVPIEGSISGNLHMEQDGQDIQLDFGFDTPGSYTVKFYDSLCPASGGAFITINGISDQSSRSVASQYLVDIADGQHSVTFSNGFQSECVEIGNIVNGPYKDQMVDLSEVEPYGISVREKSYNGTLLVYVPLNMVADQTGSDRVAFSARMLYKPTSEDWGDTQKVRVVWLVQMLVDRCQDSPCEEDAWELDQTSIVHAYDDAWYLTGMAVREDHGLDIAVIYQDPSAMPSDEARQYDDFLWLMAWGLDASFVTGRDEDGDGQRDVTVPEIYNRWGDPASGASDEMRWNIPITATEVITYHYAHQDYYVQIAMTETQRILGDHFTDYVDQGADAPTLLFAQEAYYRGVNLDSDLADTETVSDTLKITLQLDPEKSKEEVRASLNWGPYRYTNGEWQSYPIQEYWDRMEVRFDEICDQYASDPDFESIRKGQVFIAQSFYLALFRGDSSLVQIGDELLADNESEYTDLTLSDLPEEIMIEGSTLIAVLGSISEVVEALVEKPAAIKELKDFLAFVGRLDQQGQYSGFFRKHYGEIKGHLMDIGAAFLSLAVITLYCVAIAIENDPIYHVLNGYFMLQAVYDIIKTAKAMYKAAEGLTKTQKVLSALKAEGSSAIGKLSIIGLIVGAVISWGLFAWQIAVSDTEFASMAFDFAFAHQVASILAAVVMLAIAAIPIVGQIIVLIINLFDGIVYFVCGLAESEHPVCLGIQGWITVGIRWAIYSGNIMVDLGDESRLEISDFQQNLLDASLGMTPDNSLIVTTTVENTIKLIDWEDTDYSLLAGSYWWQYDSDALSSSTFRYYLDEETDKHSEELERDRIRSYEWDPNGCDPTDEGCTYTESDAARIPMPDPGINRTVDLYLTEKYAVPAQECWVVPIPYFPFVIPVCYIRTERGDSPIDLGQYMAMDVFPATLDGFYDLTSKEGGYALAWSQDSSPSFPRLLDADGDGLRTKAVGGPDPNDLLWDTDLDGLSDYFEIQLDSNPEDVDSDDDGLFDYDEVLHNTNINLADTDYDGLTDKEEIDGWEFVYDFADDGSQLATWVTSDPLTLDGDMDSFTDFQEKTYGFHPGVVSDPNILTLSSQIAELNNPTLILRLNGVDDASSFSDDSGFLNNGFCSGEHCPASGHLGKYGNAPHFDGSDDYIEVADKDTLMPDTELTLMAWVYLSDPSSSQKIAGKTSGDNGFILGVDGGQLYPEIWNSQGTQYSAQWGSIPANTWTHLAITWQTNGSLIGYINGVQVGSISAGSYSIKANTNPLIIGIAPGDRASYPAEGRIDEALLFPRALSAAEIGEQAAGRYNPADLQVKTGDQLYYQATVKNELFGRYAEGLLSTDFPAAFNELTPQDFVLNPQESQTLSGVVDVGAAASGIYTLTQEADALITDWREDSDYAELLYHFSDTDIFLNDESGSQPPRDGECPSENCPTLITGRYGNGASFDGSNDYIEADEVGKTLTSPAFSFGAWVFPQTGAAGYGSLLSFNTSNGGNRNMARFQTSDNRFCYYDDKVGYQCSSNVFAPDQWYHVMVVIFEGSSDNGYLYVNGNQEIRFSTDVRPDTNGRFSLGQEWDGGGISDFFKGYLDEVVVYARALTYQEVQELYKNPTFQVSLDESSAANTFNDSSGFNNDATCTGNACPTSGVEGISLNAAYFDGSNDYLSVPDSSALDLSQGDFTLSAWVYPQGVTPVSGCPFVREYYYNSMLYENSSTTRTCENYPLVYSRDRGDNTHRSERWTGTFEFAEGYYNFETIIDEGYRLYIDEDKVFDKWGEKTTQHDFLNNYFLLGGKHTIVLEHQNTANIKGGTIKVRLFISPDPLPVPQGILGGNDYPALQRVGNRLRLVLNETTSFLTENVLKSDRWNHVAASFDGNTWVVYVNGVEVDQFAAAGQNPDSGQNFNIGRTGTTATLNLQKLYVVDTAFVQPADTSIYVRLDGHNHPVWSHVMVSEGERDITREFTFENQAVIEIYTEASPDMGEKNHTSWGLTPYNTSARFEGQQGDVMDLFYTLESPSVPFKGYMDEVAIYKSALSSVQVEALYEAGTMVLHLPLDDAPGSSEFNDSLGKHNGACSGSSCPTAGVPGRQEMALFFDGQDDNVLVSNAGTEQVQELTVATWVRFNSLPTGADDIMRFITVGNEKAVIRYDDNPSGDLHFYLKKDDGSFASMRYGTSFVTDHWYHVAGTYDGETMRLYLDGTEVITQSVSATLTGGDIVRLSHVNETLHGYLDEVRVYRRALTADQIQQLVEDVPEMLLLLDENQGQTSFSDATDNGHTGACVDTHCPDAGAKGQIGLSALFDGKNDYIEIPDAAGLNPDTEMTLSAWVKLENTEVDQKLVGKTNNSHTRGFILGVVDGYLYPEIWDSSGNRFTAQWGQITAGYWTHLAITWETNGDLVGYINGNEVGRISVGTNAIGSSTNPLRIGIAPWNASSHPTAGRIDHVTLYNRALDPSEVRAMFRLQAKWVEDRQHTEILIDNDDPTSVLITDEIYRPNRDAILVVAASDPTTFVTQVEMGVSTNGGSTFTWTSAPACQDARTAAAWCPTFEPTIGEGHYVLAFRAVDNVGNQETPATEYHLYVDDTPPEATSNIGDDQILDPEPHAGNLWLVALSGTISDPGISGASQAGSGVSRIMVKLTDTDPVTDTLPSLEAEISGSSWSLDYPLSDADPTGSYTLSVETFDQMGNDSGWFDLVVFGVDAAPPVASLNDITAQTGLTGTITSTLTIGGLITETGSISAGISGLRISIIPAAMQSFSGTVAVYHLDEALDAASFVNVAGHGNATCSGAACPTAGQSGIWGNAAQFSGDYNHADDYLSADITSAFSDTNGLSFGGWIYPNYTPNGVVMAFDASDGTTLNQIVYQNYHIYYRDGDVDIDLGGVPNDTWSYMMVSIDADGNGATYLNGEQKASFTTSVLPDPHGKFSLGAQWDGSGYANFYNGRIDEVYIFNRALAPSETSLLIADAVLADSGSGVLTTTWAYTLPETLDGLYAINIRPSDVFSNNARRDQWQVWTGEIDTRSPEASLTIVENEEYIDAGFMNLFKVETTYTCWSRDINLVGESTANPSLDFQCPCDTLAPASTTITDTFYHELSPWYAEIFTDTVRLYERTATCSVPGPTLNNYMRACDGYGHCNVPSADIDAFEDQIPSIIYGAVLTPTHKTIITNTNSVDVSVRAYARDRIKTVNLYDSSTLIGTANVDFSCTGNITTTQQTFNWALPTNGTHMLWAKVTPCAGDAGQGMPNEVIVDTVQPPVVTIVPTSLNRQQRLSYGRVLLKGTASDTPTVGSGIAKVEVNVEGAGWDEAAYNASSWRYEWTLGEEPDNTEYEVSVRATDRAGWTTQITQTVTVDLDVPNPVTLTLTSTVTGGLVPAGNTLRVIPDSLNFSWEASEPSDKLSGYLAEWTVETVTGTASIPVAVDPDASLGVSYPALMDAQKISPSVTSIFTDGNQQVDDWGPVYIDTPLTPDYIQIPYNPANPYSRSSETPYHGWMDSGCSLLGIDRRIQESAQSGEALNDPQNFYVTWDSEALRLAWTGSNWNYDGDLFIYLDTLGDPSVPLTVTNPFTNSQDIEIAIPGAKAFIWVQDSNLATFFYWDEDHFDQDPLNASQYRFDSGLRGGLTDLYIPFDMLGIDDPTTTPLVIFAFAADEGELALWATMPATNPVNSSKVIDKSDMFAGASQLMQWLHVFAWPSLAPGTCPNYSLASSSLFGDVDLRFNLSASPEGNTYGLMSDDLFWLGEDLTTLTHTVDLSQQFTFMDVEHLPVSDGETLNYTITYENKGTYTATNVVAQAFGMYALELTPGISNTITNTLMQVNQAISITLGEIPPGVAGSISFDGYVNTTDPYNNCMSQFGDELTCQPFRENAMLGVALYDTASFIEGVPLEWLWADHVIDNEPPEFFGALRPEYIIGEGTNLFSGYAFDASGVASLTLEADPPLGSSYPTQCSDDTPTDGFWACSWDAGTGSDGDVYQLRLQATDSYNHASEWTPWRTYLLDTTAPALTPSTATAALPDTIVDNTSVTFSGLVEDTHGLGSVEVCFDGACGQASLTGEALSLQSYADNPASVVEIGVCGGGEINRTFVVTDSFTMGSVSLGLNIDHPQRDELNITLAKGANSVTVMSPPTGTPGNYANLDVLLNDANPIDLHARTDDYTELPIFERLAHPDSPLSAFQGADSAGTWTLTICDSDAAENLGSYNQAQLLLQPQNSAPTTAEWTYVVHNLDHQDYVSHTVGITAYDLVELHSETYTLTVWVDNVNPELNQGSSGSMPSLLGSFASNAVSEGELPLVGIGALPEFARVLEGNATDGGAIQQFYAMVLTPSGERLSMQVGRADNDWWFDLLASEPGDYTIWINATDEAGNADTLGPYTVTVVRALAENDGPTGLGETTNLTATILGDSGTYSYDWAFGDGSVASNQPAMVSHTYPAIGLYTATVTATTGTQAFTATTQVIVDEVIDGLNAENDSPTIYGNTTALTATVTAGSNISYAWNYGDGQPTALDSQPATYHRYPAGFFTATVTATNSVSVLTTTTHISVTDVALINDSPTALGNATTFTATISGGTVYSYTWNLGDGSDVISGSLGVISAIYDNAGFYTATVVADTSAGLITATAPVTISALTVVNDSPTILENTTTFTATTIAISGPITYTWDWGDESSVVSGTLAIRSHTYSAIGVYTAVITATNGALTATQESTVTVDTAISELNASNDSPTTLGNPTYLTATVTSGSNISYAWNFGDGSPTASGQPSAVSYTYPATGTYTAVVTATNSVSVLTTTTTVTVEETISGLALINDSPTILDSQTTLTATLTSGSHVSYEWKFGDGSPIVNNTSAVISHTYPTIGIFTAAVTATNDLGSLSASGTITITNEPIGGLAAFNDSPTALGASTTLTATVSSGGGITYTWKFGDGSPELSGSSAVVTHTYPAIGIYSAVVTATNNYNTLTTTTTITVDGNAPVSAITDPLDSQIISTTAYTIRGTAADDIALAEVEISTDGGATWQAATGTTHWSYVWDIPGENGTLYNLRSRSVDQAGNVEIPGAGITVTVDNLAPGIQILYPTEGSSITGTQVIISGTASDPSTPVAFGPTALAKTEVSTDGGTTWHLASGTSTWSYTWLLPADENGVAHTLLARATDYSGHTTWSNPIHITVDTVAPQVNAVIPLNEATDVPVDIAVVVTFSEAMDPASLAWEALPDPGGWTFLWAGDHRSVTATHAEFQEKTAYKITLNVKDQAKNPLSQPFSWTFTTKTGILQVFLPIVMR